MTEPKRPNMRSSYQREQLQAKLIAMVEANGGQIGPALTSLQIQRNTYEAWRNRYPAFKARMNVAKQNGANAAGGIVPEYDGGFASFRLRYFGHRSPQLHLEIIDAYENTPNGNITMILVPPESGKTSLFEDYASMKLALDPGFRFTVGSENIKLASKILGKVMDRMDPELPDAALDYITEFGPFVPQFGTGRSRRQTWNQHAFNVFKKTGANDRDHSMQALGFGAKIRGTRTDHLHCDDMQSEVTLNDTEKMAKVFRGDWLTRPGENAPTTINGTKVGEGDLYEVLEDEITPDILKIIRFPAIVTRVNALGESVEEPLIPRDEEAGFGWTMDQLARLRNKVGEDAWANNYMQNPRARRQMTFTEDIIERCLNPQRSVTHDCSRGAVLYFSLDPAIGSTTAIAAAEVTAEKITLLDMLGIPGLMRNEDIMQQVERLVKRYVSMGGHATELIVEAKNFQAGLSRDERLLEICDRYGLNAREHLTDVNKYDVNIGVSSMTHTFRKRQFDIPWAADDETRERMQLMIDELLSWRPLARGNRLRQDRVMALWFLWIFWRERKGERPPTTSNIKRQGMPYAPTRAGLLVPAR